MLACIHVMLLVQGPIPDVVVGDVYALLTSWCHSQGNMQQALQLVEQMMDRHVPPGQYLSPEVLSAVQQVSEAPAHAS
jgi:pentatricopeptide repeat protein